MPDPTIYNFAATKGGNYYPFRKTGTWASLMSSWKYRKARVLLCLEGKFGRIDHVYKVVFPVYVVLYIICNNRTDNILYRICSYKVNFI